MPETAKPHVSIVPSPFVSSPVPLKSMTCSAARHGIEDGVRIEDGDLLLWRGKYFVSRIFEFFSRGWFSHSAIAVNWDNQPMLLQAEFPYIQAVPLWKTVHKYDGNVYWYKLKPEFRDNGDLDLAKVFEEARKYLGAKFSVIHVLIAFAHRYFGQPLPPDPKRPRGMFCAEYVAHCFREGGKALTAKSDINTFPTDIAESGNVSFVAKLRTDPEDAI